MSRNITELEVDQSSRSLDLHSPFHELGSHHHHHSSMLSSSSSSSSSTNIVDAAQHSGYDVKSVLETNSITSENSRPPVTATSASSLSIPNLSITPSSVVVQTQLQGTTIPQKLSSPSTKNPHKSCKRSSSSSNDLIYERDRFRARLRSFNVSFPNNEVEDHSHPKTETLDASPGYCACHDEPASLEGDVNPCDVCDGIGFKTTKLSMGHPEELDTLAANKFKFEHLTLEQLKTMFHHYFNSSLPPTNEMFPWLHGLHEDNFAQRSFFLHQQQQQQQKLGLANDNNIFMDYKTAKPKNSSFLMCVTDESLPVEIHNTVRLVEILQKIDVSKSEIRDIVVLIWKSIDHEKVGNNFSYKEDEEMIDLLTADCIKLNVVPFFLNLDPDRGISLRNFQIQVAKLSTCSDFVVYGIDPEITQSIARVLWLAQRDEEQSSGISTPERKVYILDELFHEAYEQMDTVSLNAPLRSFFHFSKLSTTNLNYKLKDPLLLWDNNFQLREKIETTMMSTATKICQNVYVGNFWDHQIMVYYLQRNKSVNSSISSAAIRGYSSPRNSLMSQNCESSQDYINMLPLPKFNYKLFIQCHSDASFPDLTELAELLFKYTISSHDSEEIDESHHLSFPPSGSIGIGDCKRDNLRSVVNICKLIYLYSSSMSSRGLGSLIYCSDGYTESSLLVFCYLMYALNLPLDEVMLKLHCTYERPFYIFNSDVVILRKLEPLLRKYSPLVKQGAMNWGEMEEISSAEINEILLGAPKKNTNAKFGHIFNDDDSSLSDESSSSSEENDDDDEAIEVQKFAIDWVKEVEGSIPSKILPYLYLGSLKHASCLPLLNKLGIKKVISVGESLPWLNGYKFRKYNEITVDESDENIEIIDIHPKHRHRNPNLHWNTTIDTIMKVNNLEDDGIDELSEQLPKILDFINQEYIKTGGNTKILVHCRVGVSRSATVVIAEIMRRFQVSLPMAYLYVRVRRLNIIIQPNLRFMYELFKWEQDVKQTKSRQSKNSDDSGGDDDGNVERRYHDGTFYLREIDWFIMCREIMKLNLPYLNN
ncbi:dual specificity protein phosphatase [Candida orthopsilosis Co 90-125]|uniref:Dual specificity protein phosphatase n=1 Tax=Candida orthopsilosis (strain 90-125) TaxID=1136231 RepID=H8XAV9_CANO9|nr:dual specificity protein phosphatase [Candida orthopsilosis Co 90-125]CCG25207.1 dual specificity protein phosphatase [Candida orthopsilosis Co 90-125]